MGLLYGRPSSHGTRCGVCRNQQNSINLHAIGILYSLVIYQLVSQLVACLPSYLCNLGIRIDSSLILLFFPFFAGFSGSFYYVTQDLECNSSPIIQRLFRWNAYLL